ncbi:MAG: hypothetical protein AAF403_02525 [Pseudomonadota bacterium]
MDFKRWTQSFGGGAYAAKQKNPMLSKIDGGKAAETPQIKASSDEEGIEQVSSNEIEKELLEIPAFLRRQAN